MLSGDCSSSTFRGNLAESRPVINNSDLMMIARGVGSTVGTQRTARGRNNGQVAYNT